MAKTTYDDDYLDQMDSDETYDEFEEHTNKKGNSRKSHSARHRLEAMREERELEKMLKDVLGDYDDFYDANEFNDWE